jgi:hypothetical protein
MASGRNVGSSSMRLEIRDSRSDLNWKTRWSRESSSILWVESLRQAAEELWWPAWLRTVLSDMSYGNCKATDPVLKIPLNNVKNLNALAFSGSQAAAHWLEVPTRKDGRGGRALLRNHMRTAFNSINTSRRSVPYPFSIGFIESQVSVPQSAENQLQR